MSSQTKKLNVSLQIENLNRHLDNATQALKNFEKLAEDSKELKEWATNEITKFALSIRASKLDKDELENFFNYPYVIIPGKNDSERYLAIPKFINAQFGWLHKVTPSFNIFLVNQYVDWLGELPDYVKKELNFPDPLDIVLDGEYLVGSDTEKAFARYPEFITNREKDGRLKIDASRHFEILARLIKDGIRPFTYKHVDPDDIIQQRCDFELRDYQKQAYETFLKYSNVGIYFPPSTGKTFFGLYAATHVKGPWLVTVPSKLLVEQWIERTELYTDLKIGEDIDIMTYYAGIKKDKKYKGKIIDEVHHLPANEFSKLSMISTDYTIGLSATPQREDERENYIFALTGQPIGLSWEHFKKLGIIQTPDLHVWIIKNETERWRQLGELLDLKKKCIVFCDSIKMGKLASKRFDIPHIYGNTKQRLDKIQDNLQTVVSRVGDEGVSLPNIEQVIEISWLHGSRRQELQRFTRLLHGKETKGIGHIIMTVQEYQTDHKRLFGIMDKGFKIVLHREGIPEKVIQQTTQSKPQPKIIRSTKVVKKEISQIDDEQYPLLKNNRIRNMVSILSIGDRETLLFFIKKGNSQRSFSSIELMDEWGMIHKKNLPRKLNNLLHKKYIKKERDHYSQNLTRG